MKNTLLRWQLGVLAALCTLTFPAAAQSTYTSASTTFDFVDSSTHHKIGHLTTPYKFNQSSGCATALPVIDDALSDPIPIGFGFRFGATTYTSLYVMTNGRLQFGNTICGAGTAAVGPPQTYPYVYPNASVNNTMKVFGVDLDPTNLVSKPNYPSAANPTPCASIDTCYVSVATLGSAPARRFVVTWKNVPEWVTAAKTSGSFDLQVVLHEDGSFIYQYGNIVHGGTGTAQIGWQLTTTNYEVLSFGAGQSPPAFSAVKFYPPAPLAHYTFDEGAWTPGVAGQVLDASPSGLAGSALGLAQTVTGGKVCRAADIPPNTSGGAVDAVRTGVNLGSAQLSLLGTGSIGLWYRSRAAWTDPGATSAQLLDASAVAGQWFALSKTAAGALVFEVTDSTGSVRSVSTPAQSFAADTWVHITVTWNFNGLAGSNQDSLQIFVNAGAPAVSAFTSSGSVTAQVGTLHAGDNALGAAGPQGSLNSANGLLDELVVYNYVLTQAQALTLMNSSHGCGSLALHHLEIQHGSGSGLTCTPSTLSVRACQNAACTILYTGGLSGSLVATGAPSVQWDGSSGNASGAQFVIPAGSSSVTKNLQVTTAGSVVLGTSALSPTASAATSCNFGSPSCTFRADDSGFLFDVANHVAETLQTITVRAVRKADNQLACAPALASVTKPIGFSCAYANPTTGTLPVRVGGTALNAAGNAAAACDGAGRAIDLAFDATGTATTTVRYADVGSMTLSARYAPSGGTETNLVMTGSDGFVTRPQSFTLSNIRCTTTAAGQCAAALAAPGNNPGATAATGAAFIPAGRAFSVTVTAVNSVSAATPNYGRETVPEGVKLTASLVLPTGGQLPALANASAFGSFSAGVATGTSFSWSEVGIIKLTPSVNDGDYLGSGNVSGTISGNVGRFIPDRFAVSAPVLSHRASLGCSPASGFSYLGENFRLGWTLTAQNSAGATTQNYSGVFTKFDPTLASAWQLAGIAGSTVFSSASGRLSLGSASGSWSAGVAAGVSLTAAALRGAAPDGPFDAVFGIAPVDSDGVTTVPDLDTDVPANSADRATLATIALRWGRLRLDSAIGAADRALVLPARVQHWDGSTFATNVLDSCTTVPVAALNFGNLRRTLSTADTQAGGPVNLAAGLGALTLTAPGGGRSGSYDVALSLGSAALDASCLQPWAPGSGDAATAGANLAYLRGGWCGSSHDKDPAARASFGLQRGNANLVYRRENH